jgi:hypothetical protein
LNNYKIKINEILDNNSDKNKKPGIWVKIKNLKTGEIINKHIWWRDKDGIMHDDSVNLPAQIRDLVDNTWLEYRRN